MKVILNKDLSPLGEEGDVKEVAKGYARNFLFPRGIALPYNERTVKLFESRKEEIEARKIQKRGDAAGLKEKLESLEITLTMPAGPNGKLYGAVTSQTIIDELAKHSYQIERKKIELIGSSTGTNAVASLKNVGKYKAIVKIYESTAAEIAINIVAQEIKTETKKAPPQRSPRKYRDDAHSNETPSGETPLAENPSPEAGQAADSAGTV